MRAAIFRFLYLLAFLSSLAGVGAALAADAQSGVAPVDIAGVSGMLALRSQLAVLEGPSARQDVQAVMARSDWQIVTDRRLNGGYSSAAVWLRGALFNSSEVTVTRWLAVGSTRLERVTYFRLPADRGKAQEVIYSGNAVPLDQRPEVSHIPLFPVTLAPGERIDFALKIQTRSALDVNIALWEPSVFRQDEGRELAAQAILIGLPVLLALYALIQGVVWRDRGFLLLAVWIGFALAYICSFQGYLYRYAIPDGGELLVRAPSTIAGITSAIYAVMTLEFVGIQRVRFWKWTYRVMIATMLALSAWTALGDYRAAAQVSNMVIGIFYLFWIASMLYAWRRRMPNALLFLVSFALVWLMMCGKLLELNGIVERAWLAGWKMSWLFQLGLLPMMTLIVFGRSLEIYRKHMQMQQALLDTQAQEQVQLEKAVTERTKELREALISADEANHAKTDFLARISHDLRTPLTSILGFSDMVQASGSENAGHGRIIRRSAMHMLNMVNDLIDYARGDNADTVQKAPVYVHALINTIAQEGAELARRKNNRFAFRVVGALPPVLQLDAKRLHRILGNLLDNAAKYTSDGNIELQVECLPGTGDMAAVLEFRIKDSGCGIAPEHQARIFEPFERADAARSEPGIGLGLAIVRQWTMRMDGSIDIDSAAGVGTLITLRLPAETAAEENIARHHVLDTTEVLSLIDGSGRLVWVVEDSAEIRQLLMDQLSSLGFTVELMADGVAAIERMQAPDVRWPDLLMTDYLMPGADGGEVLRAARQYLPGVPVMLLSATPKSSHDTEGNTQQDFDASLLKPIDLLELQEALGRLLKLDELRRAEPEPDDVPLLLPPEKALRTAHQWIDLGAISDLLDWAEAVRRDYPECEAFYLRARQLIGQGNLAGLGQLCRQ
ncbi:ATP-binding protein [Herbaspirillum chlorophenolicum]|uniref:histidine kinase n=1 Tax=Herbaspirillum chlorophenolicum TaxID=211589 RepID=A0ABW8EVZ6_9BURK